SFHCHILSTYRRYFRYRRLRSRSRPAYSRTVGRRPTRPAPESSRRRPRGPKGDRMTDVGRACPTAPSGLREAAAPEVIELADGDSYRLRIAPVAKRVGDATVRMLAY